MLEQVLDLPPDRLADTDALLQRTSLASVVAAARRITDRLDFLDALEYLVFDPTSKKGLRERDQLHRILETETWIFGEEFALTASDRTLRTVLTKHLQILGRDGIAPEVTDRAKRVDLMLARTMEQAQARYEHLVVELKRPSCVLGSKEHKQITEYANAVAGDEQFRNVEVRWEFVLVGNEYDEWMRSLAHQPSHPPGEIMLLPDGRSHVIVRTWAEIMADCRHRLKFVKNALEYEPSDDASVEYLRQRYASLFTGE